MSENPKQSFEPMDDDDLTGKFLTFIIQESVYGVELFHVIEIISIQTITQVPGVPTHIRGIINLRGRIVPVIDMRLKFNQLSREYDERTCIIVVNLNDMHVGLIVDEVSEVLTVDNSAIEDIPDYNSINSNKYLKSIGKVDGKLVLNIDCEKIFLDDIASALY